MNQSGSDSGGASTSVAEPVTTIATRALSFNAMPAHAVESEAAHGEQWLVLTTRWPRLAYSRAPRARSPLLGAAQSRRRRPSSNCPWGPDGALVRMRQRLVFADPRPLTTAVFNSIANSSSAPATALGELVSTWAISVGSSSSVFHNISVSLRSSVAMADATSSSVG